MIEVSLKPSHQKNFRQRIFFLFTLFLSIVFLIFIKIGYIQVVQQETYQLYAQGQMEQRIPVRANRGQILDTNGKVIVDNRPAYSLYITPGYFPGKKEEKKREGHLKFLSRKLNMTIAELEKRITITDRQMQNKFTPILIKRDLDPEIYAELKENEKYFQGVEVKVISLRRYYLNDNLSHFLGYTGLIRRETWKDYRNKYRINPSKNPYRDPNTIMGRKGLEKSFDQTLRGEDGVAMRLINSLGQPITESSEVIKDPYPGKNIYLTINKDVQEVAKRALNGRKGVVVVSKPSTGEILALVSSPGFNSNVFTRRQNDKITEIYSNQDHPLYDRVTSNRYPPSSIFKIVVAAAALELGVPATRKYMCTGVVSVGNRFFRCHGSHGMLDLIGGIKNSCNSYFYQLGSDIGWSTIYKMGKAFGLGDTYTFHDNSGIQYEGLLPNEAWKKAQFRGEKWYPGDTLNHSIGQGYTHLSPLQVHNIVSTIANDGVIVEPYIIKKIVDPKTQSEEVFPSKIVYKNKFLKQKTLDTLKAGMRQVVENGTAGYAKYSREYLIAGKTGTAQNPQGAPHAWFTGFAPFDSVDPSQRIAVTVLIENATEGGGGFIAAPIATGIINFYFENKSLEQTQDDMGRAIFDVLPSDESNLIDIEQAQAQLNEDEQLQHEEEVLRQTKVKLETIAIEPTEQEKVEKKENSTEVHAPKVPEQPKSVVVPKEENQPKPAIQKPEIAEDRSQQLEKERQREKARLKAEEDARQVKLKKLQEQKEAAERAKILEARKQRELEQKALIEKRKRELAEQEERLRKAQVERDLKRKQQIIGDKKQDLFEAKENERIRKIIEEEEQKINRQNKDEIQE